jgi:hypothetical protein
MHPLQYRIEQTFYACWLVVAGTVTGARLLLGAKR